MQADFAKPQLNRDQKAKLKSLYQRDNHHGFSAIFQDCFWVAFAIAIADISNFWLYPLAIMIIGARQRALASLLHEAAHGTLFRSRWLNTTIGRVFCGWTILQSFDAYRTSHVLNHHPKIGELTEDPDFKYMIDAGVYHDLTRIRFLLRFFLSPFCGRSTVQYVYFLLRDRLLGPLTRPGERLEAASVVAFQMGVAIVCWHLMLLKDLLFFWYLPFLITFPLIGWFSELSEHFPLMRPTKSDKIYSSRNRYAGIIERLFIGMHGDNFHLTHHLLPGIPHWNLREATAILREDKEFCTWDDLWGGIFTSSEAERLSLVGYVVNHHQFSVRSNHPILASLQEAAT